jgi:hypothetical protein
MNQDPDWRRTRRLVQFSYVLMIVMVLSAIVGAVR